MIPRLGGCATSRVGRSGKSMNRTRRLTATIVVASLVGSVWGAEAFGRAVLDGAPAAPQSLSVTSVSKTSLRLGWRAARTPSFVRFEAYVNGAFAGTTFWTYKDMSGLACGTAYTFSVDAATFTGARSNRASIVSSTAPCGTTPTPAPAPAPPPPDTTPPSTPGNLAATSSTATSVSVSWSPSTDNVGVTGYALTVNGASAGTVTSTSYTAGGLACGTTAKIGVVALDAADNKSGQATTSVATSACPDNVPPTTPWPIVVQGTTANSISITWPAAVDNVGVVGYSVYRGPTKVASGNLPLAYTYTGLACNTSYSLSVLAYDAAGNVSSSQGSATATTGACAGDTSPPSAPGNVQIGSPTTQGVTVTWSPSTDNVGVAGYSVSVNGSVAGQTSGTSYAVGGLTCSTTYSFSVTANDAAGNTSQPTSVSGATSACPPPPPNGPTVPAQIAVATNGIDSTCVRGDLTKPCQTFQQAYKIAQLGDTVNVSAGNYPSQTIDDVSGKTSPSSSAVTFVAQGKVVLAGLLVGDQFTNPNAADNITFEGITGTSAWGIQPDAHNITFDHVSTTNIQAHGVTGFTVTNSAFGNCTVVDVNGPCDNFKVDDGSSNVLIDHDTFTNFRAAPGSAEHFECFFFGDSANVTISNSSFSGCEYYNIFAQSDSGNDNVTIQNNSFSRPFTHGSPDQDNGQNALNISNRGGAWDNWNVSGNTFATGTTFTADAGGTYTHFTIANNNFGLSGNCIAGATYSGNTWPSGGC